MDNRINEIRKQIRALRISMLEAEAIMREQINRDDDCSFVAEEVLKMRVVMSLLVEERTRLGDHEPIFVNRFMIPRRAPVVKPLAVKPLAVKPVAVKPAALRPVKRRLVPAENRAR